MPFFVIEGMDGAGKTTQAKLLYERLKEKGESYLTREPGGTRIGQKIRNLLLDKENMEMANETELFLYMASRSQLVREVLQPKLEKGCIIISDRFLLSSYVYQGIVGGVGVEKVKILGDIATEGVYPDLIFVLNVSVEEGLSRLPQQRELWDRMELKGKEFHRKIQQAYLQAAQDYKNTIVIDGNRPIEVIHQEILEKVEDVLSSYHRA
ncbi:MAG: dTMP kinase [Planctomycetota bacterium]|nr:MAG: dTMP kinase [Planctomycetota bacterium]